MASQVGSTRYLSDTRGFVTAINNGWLYNIQDAIDSVFKEVSHLILNKKAVSDNQIRIFHANEVKSFVESLTSKGVEITVTENLVCSHIHIRVNIDYNKLSDGEYYELCETVKKKAKL